MEKILITGANGLLGSRLVPYLENCGYEIVTHGYKTKADFMFDLSEKLGTYRMLEMIQPNVIINLVGLTSVELCEERPNLAYLSNTRSVENLVNWLKFAKINCHLVQISTDHVYDGIGLHTEEKVTLTNSYALTKYAGELAASQVSSTILRTNFVGRSQVSYRESLTDWVYNSMIEAKFVHVLEDVYFSPLSISVLVEMIKIAVQRKRIGTYNLGSKNGMSKANFDFAFAECLKLSTNTMTRIKSSHAKFLKAYRPTNMCMDCSKFEGEFNVKLPNLIDLISPLAEEYNESPSSDS